MRNIKYLLGTVFLSITIGAAYINAASSDLYCKKIEVPMFYAGYKTSSGNTNYVYLNTDRGFLLNIIPPANMNEKKQVQVITKYFSSLPSVDSSLDLVFSQFDNSNLSQIPSNINVLKNANIKIPMFYAGYKTSSGNTNYVYLNTDRGFLLNIIPPANMNEKKQVQVITKEFEKLPTISYTHCKYDAPTDQFLDDDGNICKAEYKVYMNFYNRKGDGECPNSSSTSSSSESSTSDSSSSVSSLEMPPNPPTDLDDNTSSDDIYPPSIPDTTE